MKRFEIMLSMVAIFLIISCSSNVHSFVDPSSGVKIPELGSGWTIKFGFGSDIAKYRSEGGIELIVRWSEGGIGSLRSSILDEYGNSKILLYEEGVDVSDISSIVFEADDLFGMALSRSIQKGKRYAEFLCSSSDSERLEMMLACKRLASSIDTVESDGRVVIEKMELPNPDFLKGVRDVYDANPSDMGLALKLVLSRYLFAIFDGRYGCESISKELFQMSDRLRKNGEKGFADNLLALIEVTGGEIYPRFEDLSWFAGQSVKIFLHAVAMERSGRVRSSMLIYEELIRKDYEFFANLRLAKLDLKGGNYKSANNRLSKIFNDETIGSDLVDALKMWVMRVSGGDISEKELRSGRGFCGESGAIHARQLGLLTIKSNPQKSIQYFTQAIEADQSHIPAYIFLARSLIEGGGGTRSSVGELKRLLARAPKTSAIRRLSLRLNAWSSNPDRGPKAEHR